MYAHAQYMLVAAHVSICSVLKIFYCGLKIQADGVKQQGAVRTANTVSPKDKRLQPINRYLIQTSNTVFEE